MLGPVCDCEAMGVVHVHAPPENPMRKLPGQILPVAVWDLSNWRERVRPATPDEIAGL